MHLTRKMENGLEAHPKVADFKRVLLFDTLTEHSDSLPVIFFKQGIIVGIECRTLQLEGQRLTYWVKVTKMRSNDVMVLYSDHFRGWL